MKLVSNANQGWKMASNWVFILIAVLTVIQQEWAEVFSPIMPAEWYPYIVGALSLLGVAARLIDQGLPKE